MANTNFQVRTAPAQRTVRDRPDWRTALAEAVTDAAELSALLDLPPSAAIPGGAVGSFPVLVPRPYLARIRRGDPNDPLLLQVLPHQKELLEQPGFCSDPLGELTAAEGPGLLAKYGNRLLIVATASCAVHCRFCFRRHFPYEKTLRHTRRWDLLLERIAADGTIREIILSGGDPLTLDDEFLGDLAARLAELPHLARLRIHSRLPIVLPQRVCDGLLSWLCGTRLTPIMVVHANHPAEIDDEVAAALVRLGRAGVTVLCQSVLLRGVNDRAEVLLELYERLVNLGVMPYYLHQLDRVAGAAHFEVPEAEGRRIIGQLRAQLPGYAVPRYVRELPGEPNKRPLA